MLWNRAGLKQWQMEIGAHLLKKGCGYQIGQIVQEKRLEPGKWRVKVITGIFYDFQENKINHTAEKRVLTNEHKKKVFSHKVKEEKAIKNFFKKR